MEEQDYHSVKAALLSHIQAVFQELEEEMAMSHQEKYTLLEDACENAADANELRVAFEQWYAEHIKELDLGHTADELWGQAVSQLDD